MSLCGCSNSSRALSLLPLRRKMGQEKEACRLCLTTDLGKAAPLLGLWLPPIHQKLPSMYKVCHY